MLKKSFKHNLGFFKSIYRHTALTELLNFLRMKKDIKRTLNISLFTVVRAVIAQLGER